MPATHRMLCITSHTCTCGNRWTHSTSILTDSCFSFLGGTPIGDEAQLPIISFSHREAPVAFGCFRCVLRTLEVPGTRNKAEPDDLLNL